MLRSLIHMVARFTVSKWRHVLVVPLLAMLAYFVQNPFRPDRDLTRAEFALLALGFVSGLFYFGLRWAETHETLRRRRR